MIFNQSTKVMNEEMINLLAESKSLELDFDTEALIYDIKKIEELKHESKDKMRNKSYSNIIEYLKELLKLAKSRKKYNLKFMFERNEIVGFPVRTVKIDEPKLKVDLSFSDYLRFKNGTLIKLKYNNLMDGLALELSSCDLGYEVEEIEKSLEDVGLVAYYNSDVLGDYLESDLARSLSEYRREASDYYSMKDKVALSYFGDKCADMTYYTEMMEKTSKYATSLIVFDILSNMSNELQLAAVYKDEIIIYVDKIVVDEALIHKLSEPHIAKIFGRNIAFKTDVEVVIIERGKEDEGIEDK